MDCFYGEQPWLRDRIDAEGMVYIASHQIQYLIGLATGVPARRDRGRIPTRERVLEGEPIEVRRLKGQLERWNHVLIRDTERKSLVEHRVHSRLSPELPGKELWLIIRRDDGERSTKYQFSNAPLDTKVARFAQMSCSRYWIERALEDAKGIGLSDYQVRSWGGITT